jgi:hypothetical protein
MDYAGINDPAHMKPTADDYAELATDSTHRAVLIRDRDAEYILVFDEGVHR